MKKAIAALLCVILILPLFGCGNRAGSSDLWGEASPSTSALLLYSYDIKGGRVSITFDQTDEQAILDRLSAVKATPATNWTAKQVKLPVYGIEIGSADGQGVRAAWSNGYLIMRDGSVYEFDFDFSALEKDYKWENWDRVITSLSDMPCGRLLSEGPKGWISTHMSPSANKSAPANISMTVTGQTADALTVELTNNGSTEWLYGEYFSLNVLLDDVWYDVPVLDDKNYGFTSIGIVLQAGESHEQTYGLSIYGTLPAGDYRLVVEGLSAEFSIPKA